MATEQVKSDHRILSVPKVKSLLSHVLGHDDFEITDLTLSPGADVGDNYSGEVCAVHVKAKVKGQERSFDWMAKLDSPDQSRKPMAKEIRMEEKECRVYNHLIPAFKKLAGDKIELNFAECHYTKQSDDEFIILMENLKAVGFRDAIDKKCGLGRDYAKLALGEIAKFHAVGYAYLKSFTGEVEGGLEAEPVLTTDFFCDKKSDLIKEIFGKFKDQQVKQWLDMMGRCEEQGQGLKDILAKATADFDLTDKRDELYAPNPNGFNVLCHGDAWFNNMLFKHDKDNKPEKCVLIDLALTRYASPCTDISYFLFLSVTPSLRRTHHLELLGHYHDTWTKTMIKLEQDPTVYPFRQLLKDYDEYCYVGFQMALWILPTILMPVDLSFSQDEFKFEDIQDEAKMAEVMKEFEGRINEAYNRSPQIRIVMSGNMIEVLERGHFKQYQ